MVYSQAMKNMIYMSLTFLVFSSLAQATQISNQADYEFMHCKATTVKANEAITHYVIDVRDTENYKLYSALALPNVTAAQLKLELVEDKIEQTVIDGYDLVWKSTAQGLQFNLIIQDNGGQGLTGQLISKSGAIEIGCIDASLEK